jgi:transcriptional regulator with XRE-family HTH domain
MTRQAPSQIALITGGNIASARLELKMTQRDVAEAVAAQVPNARLTPADVSRWERGKVEPGAKYRQPLAEVLFNGSLAAMYREPEPTGAAA